MFTRLLISLLWGFPRKRLNCFSQVFFPTCSLKDSLRGFFAISSLGRGLWPSILDSVSNPSSGAYTPFKPGLIPGFTGGEHGYYREIAENSSKTDNPSTHRQFQSGWGQAEAYFARPNSRSEDVTAVAFTKFLGRQFIDLGLAASTIIIHCYACVKPAWVNLILLFR